MMQSRKESPVLEGHLNERVYFLFKRKINADAHGFRFARSHCSFVCCLHQSRTTSGYDVAAQCGKCLCYTLRFFVCERSRLCPCRAKDGNAVAFAVRWPKAGQIIYHIPEPVYRVYEYFFNSLFISEVNRVGPLCHYCGRAHVLSPPLKSQ